MMNRHCFWLVIFLVISLGIVGCGQPVHVRTSDAQKIKVLDHNPGTLRANLDTPAMDRYVTVSLRIRYEVTPDERPVSILGSKMLKRGRVPERHWEVRGWILRFLADRTPEEFRGSRRLAAMSEEIRAGLNKLLWGSGEGRILRVLVDEVIVQG